MALSVYDETVAAVEAAEAAGVIGDQDRGAVAVLLQLAERLDDPDFPIIDGKFDNVSQSLFVKTLETLGLTPAGRERLTERKGGTGGKLAQLRAVEGGRAGGGKRAARAG